ncbi:transcriptional regulator [Corynebacterium suranareeae]|uniref:Transcriptional regulator n=1 Tax=Corynebacterium suranareeae TaxID=2506452 RepID=A0A161J898_9CORY|nr:TetR/AcrR family transcriptional regulator [Corynebacterium suranareeae]BAU95672.1 transcriptional regulator [Corynebacterium suranareeae]
MIFPDPPTGRLADIIDTAWRLVETHGWANVSTRMLANELNIKAPSLYKHVKTREDIAAHIATKAFIQLGQGLHEHCDSVEDLLSKYRLMARENPNIYRLLTSSEFPRDRLPEGLETWAGTPFYLVTGEDPIKAQALWAFAHGMAILEIDARFAGANNGSPADGVWEVGAQAFSVGESGVQEVKKR